MATINDVAKRANVGRGTVSRVINNEPFVSEETRKKVLKAIEELNYHPSSFARGLASQNSYTIGVIMDNTMDKVYANPFIYEVFRGVEKSVYEGGYNLLLLGKNTYQNGKLAVERVLQGKMVDGLILQEQIINSDYFKYIEQYNIPIVSIGKLEDRDDISWVDIDNHMAGYMAAEYLYSRGYKKIAFEGVELEKIFARERYEGYKEFIESKGLDVIEVNELLQDIEGVICLDNIYAYKILQLCKKINKKVPEEIGIITFDNYPLAEYLQPSVTNIDIDLFQLGLYAGSEMLNKLKNKSCEVSRIRIPVSVNIRETTR